MKKLMEKLEQLLELGGIKKDIAFLAVSGAAIVCSLLKWSPFPFDMAWVAIVLCGLPIILEAIIGLVTSRRTFSCRWRSSRRCASERTLPPVRSRSSCSWADFSKS